VVGLISMQHTASYGVAAAIIVLLFLHSFGKRQMPAMLFILAIGVVAYFVVGQEVGERVGGALATDIAVLEGEKDVGRAFHGRMTRWTIYLDVWDRMPTVDKVLGVSLSSEFPRLNMLGSGVHNDFLRITFTTGLFGLFVYLGFYFALFVKSLQAAKADRFLIWGAMAIMLLYSVTTTPTLYFPLLYLCLSIFAFALMPKRAWQPQRVRRRVPSQRPQMVPTAGGPAGARG
jgi:O-antigen ligase